MLKIVTNVSKISYTAKLSKCPREEHLLAQIMLYIQ